MHFMSEKLRALMKKRKQITYGMIKEYLSFDKLQTHLLSYNFLKEKRENEVNIITQIIDFDERLHCSK